MPNHGRVGNTCQYTFGQHTYQLTVKHFTPPAPASPYNKIEQFNINQTYPTTREVKFFDSVAMTPSRTNGELPAGSNLSFYFEDVNAGSGQWREIQDTSVLAQLATLGTAVTTQKPAPPPPLPPLAPAPLPVLWETKLLFEEPCPVTVSHGFLNKLKDQHEFANQDDTQVVGCKELADLATKFSSYGQQFMFKYDPHEESRRRFGSSPTFSRCGSRLRSGMCPLLASRSSLNI